MEKKLANTDLAKDLEKCKGKNLYLVDANGYRVYKIEKIENPYKANTSGKSTSSTTGSRSTGTRTGSSSTRSSSGGVKLDTRTAKPKKIKVNQPNHVDPTWKDVENFLFGKPKKKKPASKKR